MQAVTDAVRSRYRRARRFFSSDIWEAQLTSLPKGRARRYRASRVVYCTIHELLFSDVLHVRSAALTYFTVLSVVPLLAFVFAMLKGFGAYDVLVDQTIRPYLLQTFEGNKALKDAFEQILEFVSNTNVTSLGFMGLITLLYTATRLIRNVEIAMNGIWNIPEGRSPLRQLTDYATIIMVTPVCLLLAAGLGTATQVLDTVRHLAEQIGVGSVLDWAIGISGPLIVITLGLFVLYMIMPNTNVDYRSALVGAVVGGILWYAALIAHVRFQVGVAKFNALYSSFAVIPILLVWLYVSWLTVMVGGQVAAAHQRAELLGQRRRMLSAEPSLKETLALGLLLQIGEAFVRGKTLETLSSLNAQRNLPEALLDEVLRRMEEAKLVLRVKTDQDTAFALRRLPEQIRVKDVLDALRSQHVEEQPTLAKADPLAAQVLETLDEEMGHSEHNATLAELLREQRTRIESGEHPTRVVA